MRNSLRLPIVLALAATIPACSDDGVVVFDDADVAGADGESLGFEHAGAIGIDFSGDGDEIIAAKSAAIMIAIDENELVLADLALDFAIEPVVIDYAAFMVAEHEDNLLVLDELLFDFGIVPLDNPISDALRSEGDGVLRDLQVAFDFDYEYIRSQIVMHAEAFVIVDTLASVSPFVDFANFYDDTALVIDDHRFEAELILRGL